MRPPLIGITTYSQNNTYGHPITAVMEKYVTAVIKAGGVPLLIPFGYDLPSIEKLIGSVDGILFTGGGDLIPIKGEVDIPPHYLIDPDGRRDSMEFTILDKLIDSGKPFFGVCRGLQMVNVALGGTLYLHLPDQYFSKIKHNYHSGSDREYLAHHVDINRDSILYRILQDDSILVNSLHHQGIKQLAPTLIASAIASDGLIEAIELRDYQFGLAVQWHPEWLLDHPANTKLFQAFVDASSSPETINGLQ